MFRLLTFFIVLVSSSFLFGQSAVNFSGTITSTKAVPLPGANIHLLNTNKGTATDDHGKFELKNVSTGTYRIQISAIGYAAVEQSIEIGEQTSSLQVELKEEDSQLEAIVVTAEKKEEELQKIPVSISALSFRQIQQYRLWNSKDITAIVPNLYSADPGDGRNVTSLRGITSTSYDPAVATFIDGVSQFGLDTYISQLFDVERIEVLRGPQGTLYGRNAMGGVINIITRQPTNITKGFAEVSMGNYGQQRYAIGFQTPLIKDKLFLGVAGVYDQMDGFYKNKFSNSNFDKKNSLTGNYYLKYLANAQWVFTLNVKHNNNRNKGAFPLNYLPLNSANYYAVNQNAVTEMVDNTFNSGLTLSYAGSKMNFTSQTSYQSNLRYYENQLDGDFSPADVVTIFNNYGGKWNQVNVFTQEFKFASPVNSSSPFQWTVGAYLYAQNNPTKQATRFGADAAALAGDTNFSLINTTTATNTGAALFGQATYAISKKLDLTAGLRYDYERKEMSVLGEYQHDPNPNPIFTTRSDTTASVSYSALSPKVNLAYKLTGQSIVFGSYTRGFRTGGLTQLSPDPSQPPLYTYKPEYSNNIEVGVKNTFFANQLRANLALFYTEVTDAQVPTLVLPYAITVTKNTGSLSSKGIELELAATPLKGLQVEYNAGINDATYNKLQVSQDVDLSGKKQLFTPAITSMLAIQYNYSVASSQKIKLMIRGEWSYLGDQYFNLNNSIKQSGYSLLNTRIGMAIKNVELQFWARNLADQTYISYAYDFGAAHLGNPKNYGITLRVNF